MMRSSPDDDVVIDASSADRDTPWWRDAVVYQVYLRGFADGDGDGVGDIAGLRRRIPYLRDLGVDAVWVNPWYPSPQADGGYDIDDHRAIDPVFGTLADAEALVDELHAVGLRLLLDLVPNHVSATHPWFREAIAEGPEGSLRDRFIFRDGRGPTGEQPPTNWRSQFGGSAWTRVIEPDGAPGQWYLHLFAPQQPDLDWRHSEVQGDFDQTLRFWFDRGVDGFRVDVAHGLFKDHTLPDLSPSPSAWGDGLVRHPHWDREEVHDVYRQWRRLADSYDPPRVFVGEVVTDAPARTARYVRPDELHMAFNFDFLEARWNARDLVDAVTTTLDALGEVGAPATWVLSNHDVVRHLSRFARNQDRLRGHNLVDMADLDADIELGRRRARAAALLMLGLPGVASLYQGEELGLPEVEDLAPDVLLDPTWQRSGETDPGRDGCRVPIPWSGDQPPFGFSAATAIETELPQPASWQALTVASQRGDPGSMASLYRDALSVRRRHPALGGGGLDWVDRGPSVVQFERSAPHAVTNGARVRVIVNFSAPPVPLPAGRVLVASEPIEKATLPADAAAWVDVGQASPEDPGPAL